MRISPACLRFRYNWYSSFSPSSLPPLPCPVDAPEAEEALAWGRLSLPKCELDEPEKGEGEERAREEPLLRFPPPLRPSVLVSESSPLSRSRFEVPATSSTDLVLLARHADPAPSPPGASPCSCWTVAYSIIGRRSSFVHCDGDCTPVDIVLTNGSVPVSSSNAVVAVHVWKMHRNESPVGTQSRGTTFSK